MKKLLTIFIISLSTLSCTSQTNDVFKQTFKDALEMDNGVRADLDVKFTKFELSDILVKDSIQILQNIYETEKAKKIASEQKDVDLYKSRIEKYKKTADKSAVSRMMIKDQEGLLQSAEKRLEKWQNWRPDYLDRYNGRDESEVLAKLATISFSCFNPRKQAREEATDVKFLFSTDGKTIIQRVNE